MDNFNIQSKSSGFTLIETLVAISILLVAITGPMTIAQRGIQTARLSADQLVATHLAQEAIEYLHYVRHTNSLQGADWLQDIDDCLIDGVSTDGCQIDTTKNISSTSAISACPSGGCELLCRTSGGDYTYGPSCQDSQFRRTVKVYPAPSGDLEDDQVLIESSVQYTSGTLSRTVTLKDKLFNW